MIVAKFGGSSVRDASAFRRCLEIIKKERSIKLVILSATYNTTNELEEIYSLASENKKLQARKYQEIISRHKALAMELCIDDNLSHQFFDQIDKEFTKCTRKDDFLALGEIISSTLFYFFLKDNLNDEVVLIDAKSLVKTNSCYGNATPNESLIATACQKNNFENKITITQGFIGSDDLGHTTTLGREGSDYSASLLAAALNASEVQIWTDVDGIYSADPRLVKEAIPIKNLSYKQAALLAKSGAKVLFSKTLAPVLVKNIPVRVKSSLNPEKEGSLITASEALSCAITSQKSKINEDEYVITIVGPNLGDSGFYTETVTSQKHLETLVSLHKKYCLL